MCLSRCGLDCSKCAWRENCSGCSASNGQPFGGDCMLARCSQQKGLASCRECAAGGCFGESAQACSLKQQLIAEYNALGIADMEQVTDLNALKGSYVNLEYTLASGQKIKLWDDNRIYLGNQVCKKDSDRCYGLTADENYLCVCEYGENGSDAELVVYQRRKGFPKIETRCGLHCTGCEYKEPCHCGGCIETNGHPFHGECRVAVCCQQRGFVHCGECPDMPCALLTEFSCDPEQGDTPHGARIEQCRRWAKGEK